MTSSMDAVSLYSVDSETILALWSSGRLGGGQRTSAAIKPCKESRDNKVPFCEKLGCRGRGEPFPCIR